MYKDLHDIMVALLRAHGLKKGMTYQKLYDMAVAFAESLHKSDHCFHLNKFYINKTEE